MKAESFVCLQDKSQTSNISDGTMTALRSTVVTKLHERTVFPSASALVNFRRQMFEGGKYLCAPILSGSKMFRLDLQTVLEQLIKAGEVVDRGRTLTELENGQNPIPIRLGASADGGKLVEHQGFILMVLRITDREMLQNLGSYNYCCLMLQLI